MKQQSHGRVRAPWWEIAGALIGGVLAAGAVAFALMTALPPTLANLNTEVADGATAVPIAGDAAVVVPADWILTRGSDAVTVRTPDGMLHATLNVVEGDAADIVADVTGSSKNARSEVLASGMTAVHADVEHPGMVAAVESPDGRRSVRVTVEFRLADEAEVVDYRPAVAELLEGIRP